MRRLVVWWALALCVLMWWPAAAAASSPAPGRTVGPGAVADSVAGSVAAPAGHGTPGSGLGRAVPADHAPGRDGPADDHGEGGRAWPVDGPGAARPTVLRGWRPPPVPWAAGHRGVDLAARAGQRVRAAAAGHVTFAGPVAGREVLTIELSGTGTPPLRTTYEPVRALVKKGERVAAGQVVGMVRPGPFHCPEGCLHWGLRRGDRYLDPLSLLPPWMLRGGPSRLLPVFGVPDAPAPAAAISPAGWAGLLPATLLATASAWAHCRLRPATDAAGGVRAGRRAAARVSGGPRRSGPWRPRPR